MASILEFRHLRMLKELRDCDGISPAAKRLHLTQSALSHQIKFLEEYFGATLFERKTKPLCFTPTGLRLLQLADKVLPELARTEREVSQILKGDIGELRLSVECHTCFDWLMPAMDVFRLQWPKIELDIVSGFQADPISLLLSHRADVAIVSQLELQEGIMFEPLFSHEMVGIVSSDHDLANKDYWEAEDFADETMICYPVAEDMLDIYRKVLIPANIYPEKRSSELTIAIIQLVSSRRGIAVLPYWAVLPYLEKGYVVARKITEQGLQSELYAAIRDGKDDKHYLQQFCQIIREQSFSLLPGLNYLGKIDS